MGTRLLDEGHFATRREAEAWLMAGKVFCGGTKMRAMGDRVAQDALIEIKGRGQVYLSKGGYKLAGALNDFHIDISGRVCVDAGACTGGFTDCLIKANAALVYAVDVGFGQLMGSLRQNPRVVNLEKTNISDDVLQSLSPRPSFGSVDLSYLSLEKAVPAFARILGGQGELCALVKPLFEIEDAEARRSGQIAPDQYAPLLRTLIQKLNIMDGVFVTGVTNSPVTGNTGTREFFLHVTLGANQTAPDLNAAVDAAVERALQLAEYVKATE